MAGLILSVSRLFADHHYALVASSLAEYGLRGDAPQVTRAAICGGGAQQFDRRAWRRPLFTVSVRCRCSHAMGRRPVVTVTVLVSVTVEVGALTVTVRDPPVVTVVAGAVTVTVAPPGLAGCAVWPAAGIFAAFAGLTGSVRPCSTLCGCAAATHTPSRAPRVNSKSARATAAAVRLVADHAPAC
jgi:hypothetical protein